MKWRALARVAGSCLAAAALCGQEPLRLLGSGTPERRPEDRDVSIWLSGRTLAAAAAARSETTVPTPVPEPEVRPAESGEIELLEEITQSILPYPNLASEAALRLAPVPSPSAPPRSRCSRC